MIPVMAAIQEEQTIVCLGLWLLFLVTGGSDIDGINSAWSKIYHPYIIYMYTTKKSFKHVSLYVLELSKTLFHTPTSVLVGVILQFWFLMSTRTPTVYVNRVFRIVNHSNRVLFYIRCYSGFKNFFSISFGSKVMIQIGTFMY